MVFYLVIKPTDKPGKYIASWGKIGGGQQLVYGPAIFHFALFIGQWIFGGGHHMGRLKNDGHKKPVTKCITKNPTITSHAFDVNNIGNTSI